MQMKIGHLTSVHPRHDIRIFHKQCRTLAKAGDDVHLVVEGMGDSEVGGVPMFDADAPQAGRLKRMTVSSRMVHERARLLDADLYHQHDPELLPVALKLKRAGHKVVFDSREDFAGRDAVLSRYNWEGEGDKLVSLYRSILEH